MNKFANLHRRRRTPLEKLEIVLEALKQEQSVAQVAQQFEINANQLTRWIKEYREGASWVHKAQQAFLPVTIEPDN
jgi:transposase